MTTRLVDEALLQQWLRSPGPDDHKYRRGVVEFHTGSRPYPGAALLGILAALRTGVGMVRFCGPASLGGMVISSYPEAVLTPGRVDSVVVGSGLASPLHTRARARVREAFSRAVPTVIDAGALDSSEDYPALCVLTPHAAEFARLQERIFGPIKGDELQGAAVLAKHLQVTILLKGSITRVFSPAGQVWELPAGPAWLATAGTGDVLAGIAGALCAAWRTKLESAPETLGELAAAAALLHALAAWEASRARGSGPITAGDVAEHVAPVVGRLLLSKT